MTNHELLLLDGIISYSLFSILVSFSQTQKKTKGYLIFVAIYLFVFAFWFVILKYRFKFLIVPLAFLIIFHPLRYLIIWILKKDPIIYVKGVGLSNEEKEAFSFGDITFTFLMIFIPFFSPFFFHF